VAVVVVVAVTVVVALDEMVVEVVVGTGRVMGEVVDSDRGLLKGMNKACVRECTAPHTRTCCGNR
jgi:hypothetical protein